MNDICFVAELDVLVSLLTPTLFVDSQEHLSIAP